MHCHSGLTWAGPLIPSAVFVASLLGSGHCALMCGGLVGAATRSKTDQAIYHLGRLLGYMALGGVSGWLGGRVVVRFPQEVATAVAWIIGLSFVAIGVFSWKKSSWHFSIPGAGIFNDWTARLVRGNSSAAAGVSTRPRRAVYAGAVGLLSIFLPCGWLYGFLLASLSTADPADGALLMLAFWAGTLPALALSKWALGAASLIAGKFAPKLSSIFLIAAGILPIAARYLPVR